MGKDSSQPKVLVEEARALLEAAWRSTDEKRCDQLVQWAREIIQPLVDAGIPEAMWISTTMPWENFEDQSEVEFDRRYWKAVREAANAGSTKAKFRLACELDEDATREESAALFREAAEAGDPYAMWCHGLNLLGGTGGVKDEDEGLALIRKAAELKFEGAIKFVADAYANGLYDFPKDKNKSAQWWKKLSDVEVIQY